VLALAVAAVAAAEADRVRGHTVVLTREGEVYTWWRGRLRTW
jgi:hypothetical protein